MASQQQQPLQSVQLAPGRLCGSGLHTVSQLAPESLEVEPLEALPLLDEPLLVPLSIEPLCEEPLLAAPLLEEPLLVPLVEEPLVVPLVEEPLVEEPLLAPVLPAPSGSADPPELVPASSPELLLLSLQAASPTVDEAPMTTMTWNSLSMFMRE